MLDQESVAFPDLQKKISDTYAVVSHLSLAFNKLERSLQSLSDTVSTNISQKSFAEYKEEMNSLVLHLRKEFGQFFTFRTSLEDLLDCVNLKVQKVKTEVDTQEKKIFLYQEELESFKSALANSVNDLNDNMHLNVKKAKEEVCQKIESLPIPVDFVTMKQLQKEVECRTEMPSLDARNALLTARNHELRLGILERKMENALLQLKNRELGD